MTRNAATGGIGSSGGRLTKMTLESENAMQDINTALAASKEAIEQLILSGERCGPAWAAPRAPGKWSPSQIVEHVARSLEESANMATGRPSKFPSLPGVVQPIVRGLLFKRVLRKGAFPKAKTNKAMNPATGPATAAEGRRRLETAHQKFDEACRQIASQDVPMQTTIFGAVLVKDYVRFMELHTRHHGKQIADS
jgi:DinB superfamily